MSWKNTSYSGVLFSLLALVATPVFAAPTLSVTSGGENGAGNWVWNVSVTPDATLFESGETAGAVAVEVGFSITGSDLVSVTVNSAVFDYEIPGASPFAFGGEGLSTDGNNIFAALGADLSSGATQMLTIVTKGAGGGGTASGVDWLGAYGGKARLAQKKANFDDTIGSVSEKFATLVPGDTDGDGDVDATDLAAVGLNWDPSGANAPHPLLHGNFDGDTDVDASDLAAVGLNWNPAGGSGSSLSTAAVPEPSSIVLSLLAGLGLLGFRRKTQKN